MVTAYLVTFQIRAFSRCSFCILYVRMLQQSTFIMVALYKTLRHYTQQPIHLKASQHGLTKFTAALIKSGRIKSTAFVLRISLDYY